MPKSVFITGVAGFIGSHVAETLLRRGDCVFGLDNFDPFYDRALKERNLAALREFPGFRFEEGDIRDPGALSLWGRGESVDSLVHLAAKAGVRPSVADPAGYADVNVMGTIQVLEFARERSVPQVLFASSSSVYGGNAKVPFSENDVVDHPVSPYAATKKAGELLCHTWAHLYGMNIASLRFFTVYGPRQRPEMAIHKFTRRLFEGREIEVYGDGSSRRDYTYIDDIVSGVLGSLEAPPGFRVYNLGESRTISLEDLVGLLSHATGIPARLKFLPPQPGDVPVTFANISRARAEIGYDPKTPVETGVERFVEWYRGMLAGKQS
ncbi:MAG: GDP-mannose 4,6-dehydratase [Deltaproteobacteria bacterium]|nr:GDP-mannose 4,6-dehydratase [Deltaproteobacteria bacterium]